MRYHRYAAGERLPVALLVADYVINNWADYELAAPLDGFEWVRYGPDLPMVEQNTGDITDTVYGAFIESADAD
jgi:Ni/Co efflux regulator RcnB